MDTKEYSEASVQLQQALDSLSKSHDQLYRSGSGTDPFWSQYLSMDQYWTLRAAELQMQQAQSAVNTANSMVQNALDIKNNPQQLIAAADTARASYNSADAAVNVATSAINLAQKQVRQAQASMDVLNAQLSKMTIVAPASGVVASSNARVGEIAIPGSAIYTIADISIVTLDVYVPESKIGEVKIGQKASVTVASYPGQSFTGEVSYISPRAEYTPQNVQTQGQHLETLAFTVKISLPNPDYKLKEGVAANANISVGPQK
jgi:HlyD family secretion protein